MSNIAPDSQSDIMMQHLIQSLNTRLSLTESSPPSGDQDTMQAAFKFPCRQGRRFCVSCYLNGVLIGLATSQIHLICRI